MNKISNTVKENILKEIESRVKPKLSLILTKVFFIHALTATITLTVCPQFGVKFLKLPVNMMHSFMFLGMPICNLICGIFFTATSFSVMSFILKRDEIRFLKYHNIAATMTVVLTSIGFFEIMNPNLFLEFSFIWLIGAIVGSMLTLEVSSRLVLKRA